MDLSATKYKSDVILIFDMSKKIILYMRIFSRDVSHLFQKENFRNERFERPPKNKVPKIISWEYQ